MTRREFKVVEKRLGALEQAILELAAAFREAGIKPAGLGSLPSPDENPVPAPPSADHPSRIPA